MEPMKAHYNFDYLLNVLVASDALPESDVPEIASRESAQRYRLQRQRGVQPGARRTQDDVSPAEILASLHLLDSQGGVLTEEGIMMALASHEGLQFEKIDPLTLNPALITTTISRPFAHRHRLLCLSRSGDRLRVATDNPFNHEAIESLRSLSGGNVEVVVSTKTDILRHIREVYGFKRTLAAAAADLRGGTDLGNLEQLVNLKSLDEIEATDQHIVNAVEYLLHYAFEQQASDIHMEPRRNECFVRLRIDGVLHTVQKIPKVVHKAMVSRIKTMAKLDIAEKRRPQDGRIKMRHQEMEVELRLSTMPVAFGEKLVMRIFDPTILLQEVESLGFSEAEFVTFRSFVDRPNGLVLVTGPTGSGKTTTLYSALQSLSTDHVNISTIEDPIEMVVEDFNQTAVAPRAGITFAAALRTLLRQDPDIIMVGEIRDPETANQAIQAALTGHLVLSTLHTNDAPSALTRLVELGVEPFLVASTVVGVVAQRLVRKVCESCKKKTVLSEDQLMALGMSLDDGMDMPELSVWQGVGCVDCRQTGLRGRTGVFEVMPMSARLRSLVMAREASSEMMRTARQDGMSTLRESAVGKLASGMTSFEEVLKTTVQ